MWDVGSRTPPDFYRLPLDKRDDRFPMLHDEQDAPAPVDVSRAIRQDESLKKSRRRACLVAQVCEDFRGSEIVVLDVSHITAMFDFFVIASGINSRQMRATAEAVDDAMEEAGSPRMGVEGFHGPWICQDYGDVVLHLFTEDLRSHYDLENLWGDAVPVDWKAELAAEKA